MKLFGGNSNSVAKKAKNPTASGLGTFGGVYTPSILTILGVIMYLRFGEVVGSVGLIGTLVIVTLSTSITFLTSLSICAIATDRVVRVGGAYYMISRSLGIETGGAVGIPLYFAQALSVSLYTIGFAESVVTSFTGLENYQVYIALAVTVAVAILALTSADLAIKSQYFIMAAIAISLVTFTLGHPVDIAGNPVSGENIDMFAAPAAGSKSFWEIFALFFPAVTGIMAGVSLSGDLRDPIKSIPSGTLASVGTGYVIYMILPVLLAMRADPATLVENSPLVMQQISIWGPSILLGVWGATLSSALGSILGAPRVLQALARDGVLPDWMSFLGNGSGKDDEPRIGTAVTLVVAIAGVCIGDLDLIAPVLTMFFLTTYLVLNVSAAIEGFLQSPSFRPTFKVPWFLSLLGAAGCLAVMFLINPVATVVAAVVVLLIYLWLQRRELTTTWGDVRRGLWMALLREAILQTDHTQDTKNWRPSILVFSGAPSRRWSLIRLADALTHKRGLITVSSVLPVGSCDLARKMTLEKRISNYLERRGVQALVRLVTAEEPFEGATQLVATYGLGSVVPNTILMGDSDHVGKRDNYCSAIATFHEARRNVIILRESQRGFGRRKKIDIWWKGMQANGSLMLLLAYLLRKDIEWRNAQLFLKLVVPDDSAAIAAKENVKNLIEKLRLSAIPTILVSQGRSFKEILHSSSVDADLVFLGIAKPDREKFREYYENLQVLASGLPTTVMFVLAAPDFAFEEVLSEAN
ncbi:MAG: Na-K-Cl cotransporter [Prochloraceae cyanobacterium]